MKSIILVFLAVEGKVSSCFSCHGNSYNQCNNRGKIKKCQNNQEVCQVHVRKRNGKVEQVILPII